MRTRAVNVAGDTARPVEVREIPDHDRSAAIQDVADCCEPAVIADVDHDLVPVVEQRLRGPPFMSHAPRPYRRPLAIVPRERVAVRPRRQVARRYDVDVPVQHQGGSAGPCL